MSNAFTYRMPAGIPGNLSRNPGLDTVEPQVYDQTAGQMPTVFGIPVKYISGHVSSIQSGDTIANVMEGFLVRPFPTQDPSNEALGSSTPNPASVADVLKSGYISVFVQGSYPSAVPSKGSVAYVRVTAAHGLAVGGVESDADGGNCQAIPSTWFTGAMDANGMCEVGYNI
jgi:hypothetical protein